MARLSSDERGLPQVLIPRPAWCIIPGRCSHGRSARTGRRASEADARPAGERRPRRRIRAMKAGIHPVYELRTFHCYGCGTEWQTRTTIEPHTSDGKIHLDICSNCHPFFTGKQKLIDKAGRVERFRKRYSKKEAPAKAAAEPEPAETHQRQGRAHGVR